MIAKLLLTNRLALSQSPWNISGEFVFTWRCLNEAVSCVMWRVRHREVHLALLVFDRMSPSSAPALRPIANPVKYHTRTMASCQKDIFEIHWQFFEMMYMLFDVGGGKSEFARVNPFRVVSPRFALLFCYARACSLSVALLPRHSPVLARVALYHLPKPSAVEENLFLNHDMVPTRSDLVLIIQLLLKCNRGAHNLDLGYLSYFIHTTYSLLFKDVWWGKSGAFMKLDIL